MCPRRGVKNLKTLTLIFSNKGLAEIYSSFQNVKVSLLGDWTPKKSAPTVLVGPDKHLLI
jgi:hypothetical protein